MIKNVIIGVLLFISSTLMIYAFIKASEAEKNMAVAEEQRAVAEENAAMASLQAELAIERAAEAEDLRQQLENCK